MTEALGQVTILDGNTFVVSDAAGDIEASPTDPSGLFVYDTRFLSRWVLTINGERLHAMSVDDVQYFEVRHVVVPDEATVYTNSKLSVMRRQAARIAAGILDAAQFFNNRLPEAIGGYERSLTHYPVRYPTACSPQAWSAGAPLLFLRIMLGLEPSGNNMVVNPALPGGISHIELLDIAGRWGRVDAFARERTGTERQQALHPQLDAAPV